MKYTEACDNLKNSCRLFLFTDRTYISLLFILALLLCHHLLKGQLLGAGIDFEISFVRVVGLMQCWKEGLLLGRWLPDIIFGNGYPLLNFYAPLFTYLAAGLGWIFRDPVAGMNSALILTFFFSGAAMYYFAREFWGKEGAFLAATAYMYTPYHIWDIFLRGACAEMLSSVFFPLVALALFKVHQRKDLAATLVAMVAMAGLILAHNLMMLVFLPIAACYAVFLSLTGTGPAAAKRKGLLLSVAAFAGALGLTAYFWAPAFYERQFVMLARVLHGIDVREELLNLQQLFGEAWKVYPLKRPMPAFQLGAFHSLFAGLALVSWMKIRRDGRRGHVQVMFWAGVAVACGYLMTVYSGWLWEGAAVMRYFQFPWRLFLVLNFVLCFTMGGLGVAWGGRWARGGVFLAAAVLVAANIGFCKPDAPMQDLKGTDWAAWLYRKNPGDAMEYLPSGVKRVPGPSLPMFEVVRGSGDIIVDDPRPAARKALRVRTATGALVAYHHFYFPGWVVKVDGKESRILSGNDLGWIVFVVPPGEHRVEVAFGPTPVRVAGNAVSAAAWLLVLGGFLYSLRVIKRS